MKYIELFKIQTILRCKTIIRMKPSTKISRNKMRSIPKSRAGVPYNEFLVQLSTKIETIEYIEIGVSRGDLVKGISAQIAVGV